jgi:hypothetical protein
MDAMHAGQGINRLGGKHASTDFKRDQGAVWTQSDERPCLPQPRLGLFQTVFHLCDSLRFSATEVD